MKRLIISMCQKNVINCWSIRILGLSFRYSQLRILDKQLFFTCKYEIRNTNCTSTCSCKKIYIKKQILKY